MLQFYPKWWPYPWRNVFKGRINLVTPLVWYASSFIFFLLHTWRGFEAVPTQCFLDSESFVNGEPWAAFCFEGKRKQGWRFTSNVFWLKPLAPCGSSQLSFLPQDFDIVRAFQCMAGLLTKERQSCPALPHWIERNLQPSHWTWNKLLLPQASPDCMPFFFFSFNSKNHNSICVKWLAL